MSFNERVRQRRIELGLSQAELGKMAGVPQSTIGQIENGRNKSSTKILELANALQTTVEYLVNGVKTKAQGISNISATNFCTNRVPVISWVQAGNWLDIEHYDSDDMEYVQTVKFIEDGFALRVHGDSMQPEFADGDIIVIDPHAPQDASCYVVAVHDNQATLKKLVYDGTTPYLKPLNPQYPMLSWDESTRIVGVVKQKIKTY